MRRDGPNMPRNLGFRSDVRYRMRPRELNSLFHGTGQVPSTKTAQMCEVVLIRLLAGGKLKVPGHVLNAFAYRLVWGEYFVPLPSRVPQTLYECGWIDATGALTEDGRSHASSIHSALDFESVAGAQ